MTWHIKYGLNKNPFEKNTLKAKDELINQEKTIQKILYWTESGSIIEIIGEKTSGKTRILLEIIKKYEGLGKVALINTDSEFDVENILIKSQSKLKQLLKIKPKNMIILIENINEITPKTQKDLQSAFDSNQVKSIIITSTKKQQFIPSFQDRIGTRKITLKKLTKKIQLEIIKQRLKGTNYLNPSLIEHTQKKTKSFNELLEVLEKASKIAYKKGNKTVTINQINQALKVRK